MNRDCSICGGSGIVERDSVAYECECAFVRRMAAAMPPYLRRAEVKKEHLALPVMKCIKKHVMVVASWHDMKAILKAVMIANPKIYLKVTSDREIRDVYVGNKSKAARGSADDDGPIYNSLEDLMDQPDLVVVRLNELFYKNKAASGALEEAISYRLDRDKPTWLFSDSDKPFSLGSHAWSESVAEVVRSNFPFTKVPRILPPPTIDGSSNQFNDVSPVIQSTFLSSPASTVPNSAPPSFVPVKEPITHEPVISDSVKSNPMKPTTQRVDSSSQEKLEKKIRPSEDMDAPMSLSMYGAGIKPSKPGSSFRKGRLWKGF